MFELALTEEEDLIRKTAADFAVGRLRDACRAHEKAGSVAEDVAGAYSELGFAGIELPRDLDGGELGPLAKALVLEGLAAGDAAAALALDGLGPAAYPLLEMGGASGRELIGKHAGQRAWVVIDDHEEHLRREEGRIRGTWPWAPAPEGVGLLVVLQKERGFVLTEGVKSRAVLPCALHAAGSSELDVDAPIAHELADARGMARARARLRLYASSLLVGVASASLANASEYTQERVAFGRPIAHHQGVAFLLAGLATQVDAARLSVWRAAWALEQDGDPTEAAAQAFLDAADAALECGEQGVQLLGGHGYMKDHLVEKWMREARTIAQLWGGRDAALDAITERTLETSAKPAFVVPPWGA